MIGTRRAEEAKVFDGDAGYHQFRNEAGEPYGSLEVFWDDADVPPHGGDARNYEADGTPVKPGWYWWSCWPGQLPDSEPHGPFGSSHAALADALEQGEE